MCSNFNYCDGCVNKKKNTIIVLCRKPFKFTGECKNVVEKILKKGEIKEISEWDGIGTSCTDCRSIVESHKKGIFVTNIKGDVYLWCPSCFKNILTKGRGLKIITTPEFSVGRHVLIKKVDIEEKNIKPAVVKKAKRKVWTRFGGYVL